MSRMWLSVCVLGLCGAGCAPGDAQLRLLAQARKGLATVAEAEAGRQQVIDSLQAAQRRRLDEAFDDDARQQSALTSDWVIEARQAYVVGLDALAEQRLASRRAGEAIQSNVKAIDAALRRLESIQAVYTRWWEELSQ